MVGLHSVHGTDASVGATAGTFDDINTVGDPQILIDEATKYHGFLFSGSPVAQTTAEAQSGRVRLTSTSLDIVGEIWTYGAAIGAQIATNDQGANFPVQLVLLDMKAGGDERITSAFTTYTPDPTDAWSVAIGQLHSDKDQPPADWWPYFAAYQPPPHQGGDGAGATISATTRTTLGAVTMEGKFKTMCGILPMAVKDAVGTAGEEAVGVLELTSTITAVAPYFVPLPSIGPTLGTPVGAPITHAPGRWLPAYVRRTEAVDRTFEPFVTLSTAVAAADAFNYSLAFRVG